VIRAAPSLVARTDGEVEEYEPSISLATDTTSSAARAEESGWTATGGAGK
jgi:hypothetical protein